jgi:predicted nucleotide-binding protein
MKVFLSWSGDRSRQLATALRDWLPGVLQSVEPWLSAEDTPLGSRWASDIARVLQDVDVGILCLTPENLNSPWLLYEAGALSKRLEGSILCPYALDLSPAEIPGPLAQFQCARANKDDTYRLLRTLNSVGPSSHLSEPVLQRVFEANWPWLEERIRGLTSPASLSADRTLTADDKLDEILRLLRQSGVTAATAVTGDTPPAAPVITAQGSGHRPRIFIGSSSEGLQVAESIQLGLDEATECTVWNQSAFDPSKTAIESLVDISREFDCAVLVLTPDDMVMKRGATKAAPRDNIIFEAGLFTGTLGRARTFLVYCRDAKIALPSDLAGVTAATYAERSDGNLHAALGPVCTRIKRALGVA